MDENIEGTRPRWGRRLGIAAAVLVILLVAVYFTATSALFLKGFILPRAGKAVNAEITVEDASISPFSSVVLKNLRLRTTGTEPLLTAGEVRLRYGLLIPRVMGRGGTSDAGEPGCEGAKCSAHPACRRHGWVTWVGGTWCTLKREHHGVDSAQLLIGFACRALLLRP